MVQADQGFTTQTRIGIWNSASSVPAGKNRRDVTPVFLEPFRYVPLILAFVSLGVSVVQFCIDFIGVYRRPSAANSCFVFP